MYQEFKKRLLEEMERRRDMIVLRTEAPSPEPLFEVSSVNDKLYNRILDEFDRIAIRHVEQLLYVLCKKYNVEAEMTGDIRYFDISVVIHHVRTYIEFKSVSIFNSELLRKMIEKAKRCASPVYLVFLLKDGQQARRYLAKQEYRINETGTIPNLRIMLFEDLVLELFGREELDAFQKSMITYKDEMHQAVGYQITEIFNEHNLGTLKNELAVELQSFDYDRVKAERFAEIHSENPAFRDLYGYNFNSIKNRFISGCRYQLLLGSSDFAMSFLTSEWLNKKYFSFEEMDNTFIVSGYLKSIEQLLWDIIWIVGQGRLIRRKERQDHSGQKIPIEEERLEDIDSTLGSLNSFITDYNNSDLFESVFGNGTRFVMSYLRKQLSLWTTKYRNGYFHKHNLVRRDIIDSIRDETFFLYLLILGSIALDADALSSLGM